MVQRMPCNPIEIGGVSRHKRLIVNQTRSGDNRVTERHFLLLAQFRRLLDYVLRYRMNNNARKKSFQCFLVLLR